MLAVVYLYNFIVNLVMIWNGGIFTDEYQLQPTDYNGGSFGLIMLNGSILISLICFGTLLWISVKAVNAD